MNLESIWTPSPQYENNATGFWDIRKCDGVNSTPDFIYTQCYPKLVLTGDVRGADTSAIIDPGYVNTGEFYEYQVTVQAFYSNGHEAFTVQEYFNTQPLELMEIACSTFISHIKSNHFEGPLQRAGLSTEYCWQSLIFVKNYLFLKNII